MKKGQYGKTKNENSEQERKKYHGTKLVPFFGFLVLFAVLASTLYAGFLGAKEVFSWGKFSLTEGLKNEQEKEYQKVRQETKTTIDLARQLQGEVENFKQGKILKSEEKQSLWPKIRALEKSADGLRMNFDDYFQDISIHYFFREDEKMTSYVYATSDLGFTLNRIVRALEIGLTQTRPTKDTLFFLQEELKELDWQIERLEGLEREIEQALIKS